MKKHITRTSTLILGGAFCLAFAGLALYLALGMIDSLYAYRSPLRERPPAPGAAVGQPLTRRVVFVLVDGLRDDTSRQLEVMPFLKELRQAGAWAVMQSRPSSFSQPAYTSLFTGAWPDISDGPAMNLELEDLPTWTQDNLLLALQRAGLKTALSGYNWFEKLAPEGTVSASFYTAGEDQAADREVVDAALPWLRSGEYPFVFIHLDQVDYAGHHEGGPRDPRWNAAARRSDDLLREIAAELDFSQDTLLITSDHGHLDRGGHGGQDPIVLIEPFVLVGERVRPGFYRQIAMTDVAPTLAVLLGANIPATSQGQVRTEMLELSGAESQAIAAALEAQQKGLAEDYQAAIGSRIALMLDTHDPVANYQFTLEFARYARLSSERLQRAVLAVVLALAPAWLAYKRRWKELPWLMLAAALYALVFNFRYAVLDGLTYSFSSVTGQADLIVYCAITTLAAMTLGWLPSALGLRLFQQGPAKAARLWLGLILATLYFLLLPMLWSFTLNGPAVSWTLPDFSSMFAGFLATIQALFVSSFGVIFTGLIAAIRWVKSRRVMGPWPKTQRPARAHHP